MPAQRKLSLRQMELLTEFAEKHPNIALGRFQGPQANQAARQAWKSLASRLNCVAEGTFKTPDQWRRYWIEFKARTKTKAADSRRNALSTGGGPNKLAPLTSIEERVLALIGQVAVEGLPEVRIPINIPTEEVASANPSINIPSQPNPTTFELEIEVETVDNFQPPTPPSTTRPPDHTQTTSLPKREDSHSQNSTSNPHPLNEQRLRRSRPKRRDPNVPQWAYELELKRIEAEDRRTAVAEKQVEVQLKILTEMTEIKLALLELTVAVKERKT